MLDEEYPCFGFTSPLSIYSDVVRQTKLPLQSLFSFVVMAARLLVSSLFLCLLLSSMVMAEDEPIKLCGSKLASYYAQLSCEGEVASAASEYSEYCWLPSRVRNTAIRFFILHTNSLVREARNEESITRIAHSISRLSNPRDEGRVVVTI